MRRPLPWLRTCLAVVPTAASMAGFDDRGRKFDAVGNLLDGWSPADASECEARGKCTAGQYTQDIPEAGAGVKQDGRMTLGEDTADNGGLCKTFMALQNALARQGRDTDTRENGGQPEARVKACRVW